MSTTKRAPRPKPEKATAPPAKIADLQAQIQQLKTDLDECSKAKAQAGAAQVEADKKLAQVQAALEAMTGERDKAINSNADEVAVLNASVDSVIGERDELKHEVEMLQAEVKQEQQNVAQANANAVLVSNSLHATIDQKTAEIEKLKADAAAAQLLEIEIARLRGANTELSDKLVAAQQPVPTPEPEYSQPNLYAWGFWGMSTVAAILAGFVTWLINHPHFFD